MILVIAQLRRTGTPHIAVASLFSPPRFIHLHRRAGANLLLHLDELRLQLLVYALCQSDDLPTTDPESMQARYIRLDLSHGQAHHRPQVGNQAGNLHAEASLSHYFPTHIQWGFPPGARLPTPAVVHDMLRHFDWRGRCKLDHLSPTCHADPSQRIRTHRTLLDRMLHDTRRSLQTSSVIVPRIALLLLGFWLDHIGFHERWGRRLLLFQLLDAFLRHC